MTPPLIDAKAPYTRNVFLEKPTTNGVNVDIPTNLNILLSIKAFFTFFE